MKVTLQMAREAKRSPAARGLAARPQVNGIGITKGADGYALKVDLVAPVVDDEPLPDRIDGVPVSVDIVGRPYAA